jgi:hypothetical protein
VLAKLQLRLSKERPSPSCGSSGGPAPVPNVAPDAPDVALAEGKSKKAATGRRDAHGRKKAWRAQLQKAKGIE